MRKYLVPIKDAEHSVHTLQYAIDLAEFIGAELYVTKVYSPQPKATGAGMSKVERILQEDSQEDLNKLLQQVDTKGVTIKAKPVKGRVEGKIKSLGEQVGANMIIVSSQTAEENPKYFLGPMSGTLVRNTSIPVMIIPPGAKFSSYKNALIAFKSGVLKKESIWGSIKTLKEHDVKITPLQVITPAMEEEEKVISTSLLVRSEAPKIVEAKTIFDGVSDELAKNEYELVCVIRRKRGFFSKLWEGNSVKKKDFDSSVPVLVLN